MSTKEGKSKLGQIVKDHAWQFIIGAAIAIAAIIVPALLSLRVPPEKPPKRLIVEQVDLKNLTDFPNTVADRTRMLIDGKEEKDVRLLVYVIDYSGDPAIRPADFEAPISGAVHQSRKIIAVQQSFERSSLHDPVRIDRKGSAARDTQISCEVQIKDEQTFEIRPMLINPEEWFKIEVYTAASAPDSLSPKAQNKLNSKDKTELVSSGWGEVTWSCRIAGVKCPATRLDVVLDAVESSSWFPTEPLEAKISHTGWSVYFIVVFTILNLIMMLLLAKQTFLVREGAATQLTLFAVAVFLSMAVAEILADWYFQSNSLTNQPKYAQALLFLDVIFLILLIIGASRNRKRGGRRRGAIPQAEPREETRSLD